MNISFKNIIAGIVIASVMQSGIECRRLILVNNTPGDVIFALMYEDFDEWKCAFTAQHKGNCPDTFPLGPHGKWRLDTGGKRIKEVRLGAGFNGESIRLSKAMDQDPKAYGIFYSIASGTPTLASYDEGTTRQRGYDWSDWNNAGKKIVKNK